MTSSTFLPESSRARDLTRRWRPLFMATNFGTAYSTITETFDRGLWRRTADAIPDKVKCISSDIPAYLLESPELLFILRSHEARGVRCEFSR